MPQDPQIGDSFRIAFQAFGRKCFLEKNSATRPKPGGVTELFENTIVLSLLAAQVVGPIPATQAHASGSTPAPPKIHGS